MNTLLLLVLAVSLLSALLFHSFAVQGKARSWAFFTYGLLWSGVKEFGFAYAPYILSSRNPLACKLFVIAGWVIAFYLSWRLAELIADRLSLTAGRTASVIIISGLGIAAISYFMEAHGPHLGLWKWDIPHPNRLCTLFFVGGCSVRILEAWAYLGAHFLFSFLTVFCTPRTTHDLFWKPLVLLLPFSALITLYQESPVPELVLLGLLLAAFILFRFVKVSPGSTPAHSTMLSAIPPAALIIIMSAVAVLHVRAGIKADLFVSFLPAVFLLLLTLRRLPLPLVYLSAPVVLFLLKEKGIPVAAELFVVLLLQLSAVFSVANVRRNTGAA